MITLEQIRAKLQEAIKNSGLTQTQLAKKLNIYQTAVSQYLSGRAMPALDTFANLCAVLDLDPAEILCLNEYDKDNKSVHISGSFNNNSGNINFKT